MTPTVMIFAKPPRIGLSKTRLAKDVGGTQARRIARFTLGRTMRAASSPAWRTELHITPFTACRETLGGLWSPRLPRVPQVAGDLGDRLTHAMLAAPPGPVIFLGADTPGITRNHIRQCVQRLGPRDAIFGPARDGGFWLLGLGHGLRAKEVFENVRWSGPHALEDVRANLPVEADVSKLETLVDIDTGDDWKAYKIQGSKHS